MGMRSVCVWQRPVSKCPECEKLARTRPHLFFLSPLYVPSLARSLFLTRSSCAHKVVDFREYKSLSCKRIFHKINRSTPRGDQFARQDIAQHTRSCGKTPEVQTPELLLACHPLPPPPLRPAPHPAPKTPFIDPLEESLLLLLLYGVAYKYRQEFPTCYIITCCPTCDPMSSNTSQV
jgi:hypothetical protein